MRGCLRKTLDPSTPRPLERYLIGQGNLIELFHLRNKSVLIKNKQRYQHNPAHEYLKPMRITSDDIFLIESICQSRK